MNIRFRAANIVFQILLEILFLSQSGIVLYLIIKYPEYHSGDKIKEIKNIEIFILIQHLIPILLIAICGIRAVFYKEVYLLCCYILL